MLVVVWVVTYSILGLYVSAAIPLAYQVISVINLVLFARTKRYRFFRACELGLSLLLPFFLQLSLGGFVASSGVILWSFTALLGALLFSGPREAIRWGLAFVAVIAASAILDPLLTNQADTPPPLMIAFFTLNILGVAGTCYALLLYFVGERDRAAAMAATEREGSERLHLNVLPSQIAERLKSGESVIADASSEVGVLFADIAGFTPLSARLTPEEIVQLLDGIFTAFDELAAQHGLEKIKTIGDAYMVAPGSSIPNPGTSHPLAQMALEMQWDGRAAAEHRVSDRDRHRPGRRRRHRTQQVHLRPVG